MTPYCHLPARKHHPGGCAQQGPEGTGYPLLLLGERGKGPEKGEAPSGRKQNRGRRERNGCPGHGVRSPGIQSRSSVTDNWEMEMITWEISHDLGKPFPSLPSRTQFLHLENGAWNSRPLRYPEVYHPKQNHQAPAGEVSLLVILVTSVAITQRNWCGLR